MPNRTVAAVPVPVHKWQLWSPRLLNHEYAGHPAACSSALTCVRSPTYFKWKVADRQLLLWLQDCQRGGADPADLLDAAA